MTRLSRRTFGLGALCAIGASLAGTVAIADDEPDPEREALDPVEVERRQTGADATDTTDLDGEELAALIEDSHDSRCLCPVCSGGSW